MSENPMAGAMRLMSEIRNSHYTKKHRDCGMKPGEYKNEVFNTDDCDSGDAAVEKAEKAEKTEKPSRARAKRKAKVNKPVEAKKPVVKKEGKAVRKRVRKVAKRQSGQSAYSITIVGAVKLPGYALDEGEKLAIVRLTPIKGDVRC